MIDRISPLREFYESFADLLPGATGFEARNSLSNRLKGKEAITEKYLIRRHLGMQQPLGNEEFDEA